LCATDAAKSATDEAPEGEAATALKAPGILVFTLSVVVSLAVLFARFFGATVP
jgi:hypothetical protein